MKNRFLCLLFAVLAIGWAQSAVPSADKDTPTITFESFWEAATPQRYSITVKSGGETTYVSGNPTRSPEEGEEKEEDFHLEFAMSPAIREKVFRLAQQAGYFNGDFDYTKHVVANTGRKTLSYADPARHFQTVFNYSENKAIQGLAHIFLGISSTIEHGRKIRFKYKYDKLGLEDELRATEDAAGRQELEELQLIVPVLQQIAGDSSVLNIARQRAHRLLARSSAK